MLKKLNLLDMAILILILAVCFGGFIYLVKAATADMSLVTVAISVDDKTAELFSPGEEIYLTTGENLGKITVIKTLGDQKALEITRKRETGSKNIKIGQTVEFRSSKALASGVVYSVKQQKDKEKETENNNNNSENNSAEAFGGEGK